MTTTQKRDLLAECYTSAEELARQFSAEASARDIERRAPLAEIDALKSSPLHLLLVPRDAGGVGGTVADYLRITSILARGDASIAQLYLVHTFFTLQVAQCYDAVVRARWLERIVNERVFLGNAFSEIGTKTFLEIRTEIRATEEGKFVLNGKKFYCTGSLTSDVLAVLATFRSDQTLDEPELLIALVDVTASGATIHDDYVGMGQRTTGSGTVELTDVSVGAEDCLPTDLYRAPESVFGLHAQGGFAAIFAGIARAALDTGVMWAREKSRPSPQSGVERAVDDPYTLLRVGEMSTLASSGETMVERMASAVEDHERAPSASTRARAAVAVSEAKAHTTTVSLRVAEMLFQLSGASASLEKYNLNRFWRDARALTIHDQVDYKYRWVGDYLLTGTAPPVTSYS